MNELKKDLLQLGGALLAITLVVALCLGMVDSATRDRIIERKRQDIENAMAEICGTDVTFEEITETPADPLIKQANRIMKDGQPNGVCVQVEPTGFGGALTMIVGVDAEGAVIGVKIVSMSETPGLGTNAQKPKWLAQYAGAQSPLSVVKTPGGNPGEIVALSGATITSKGVTQGVQSALDYAATLE